MKYKDPITGEYKELFLKASDTLPIGSIVPYGSNDIPANWLLCDGRAVSRTTYANLFSVIGTNFGEGDGTTTFNLPDFRTRVPVGLYSEDIDFDTIGNAGGEKEHTLTIEEMPTHSHQFLFDQTPGSNINTVQAGGASAWARDTTTSGNDQPHNIMQPYQVVNYIIKSAMSVGVIGNVLNNKSDSKKDTYSCNYLNKAIQEVYSTEEVKTNEIWIDGKPIYRKVIDLGQLPNNSTKAVETGLNSEEIRIVKISGNASTSTGNYQAGLNDINTRLSLLPDGKLSIRTADDFSPYYGYAILEYTKTTDSGITN